MVPGKGFKNLFELQQKIVKIKSYVHFSSTKFCENLRPLRKKNLAKIYWQDPLGLYINIQEDPLELLQDSYKTHKIHTRELYDLEIVMNTHGVK